MADSRIYITLNRRSEWQRSLLSGLTIKDNYLVSEVGLKTAYLIITGSVDSAEYDFLWSNILVDADYGADIILKISAYSANTTTVLLNGRTLELDSFLADDDVSAEKRAEIIAPLFIPLLSNCTDGLINLKGRYIWLKIEFIGFEKHEITLKKIKLLYKAEQMVDYLPEVYRVEDGVNGFLHRFLSIFDSSFFDMENHIEKLPASFDYRSADGIKLRNLADWMNVTNTEYQSDGEVRSRIANALSDFKLLGTKPGIIRAIEREYGVTPNVIEYFSVRDMIHEGKNRDDYRRLFGDNPYRFFVILPENTFKSTHEANVFMELLKSVIPANTEAEVIVLKNAVILGCHTYLGVNSILGDYHAADVGERISYDTVLGGELPVTKQN